MSRIFSYTRVSVETSTTENQDIEIAAAGYDIEPGRVHRDVISGTVPAMERPDFQRLMIKVEKGDSVVVTKIDRLGRDTADVLTSIDKFKANGVKVICLQLSGLDLTSPAGALIVSCLAAVATMERELMLERQSVGIARLKAARAAGEPLPLGRPSKTTEADKKAIRNAHAEGASISQLARDYKVSRGTILNVLEASAAM